MINYILVSQGIKIYETNDLLEAINMRNKANIDWREYVEECYENWEIPADNEVFLYVEEIAEGIRDIYLFEGE